MSVRWLMGLSLIWMLSQMVCLIIEGSYVGDSEIDVINDLAALNILDSSGLLGLPMLMLEFFWALPKIIGFDYSFLTGGYAIIRMIMMCLTIGITWGIIQTFGPSLYGMVSSLFKLGR